MDWLSLLVPFLLLLSAPRAFSPIPQTLPASWSWAGGNVMQYTVSNPTDRDLGFVLVRAIDNQPPTLYGGTYSYGCYPFDGTDHFDRQPGLPGPTPPGNGPFPIVVVGGGLWPWRHLGFLFVVPAHGSVSFTEYWTGHWPITSLTAYVVQPAEVAPRAVWWSQQAVAAYQQVNPGYAGPPSNPYDAGPVLRVAPVDPNMPYHDTYPGQTVRDGTVGDYRTRQLLGIAALIGAAAFGGMLLLGRKTQPEKPRESTMGERIDRHHQGLRELEEAFPGSVSPEVKAEMERRAAWKRYH